MSISRAPSTTIFWWTALKRLPSHSPCFLASGSRWILPDWTSATTMSRAISEVVGPGPSLPSRMRAMAPEGTSGSGTRQPGGGGSFSERAQPRVEQRGGARERDEAEAARPQGRADPEERGEGADLDLAEGGQADRDHPRAAGAPPQVRGDPELEEALGEEIGQSPRRVGEEHQARHA